MAHVSVVLVVLLTSFTVRAAPYAFPSPPFKLTEAAELGMAGAEPQYQADPDNPRAVAAYAMSLKARGRIAEAIKVAEACTQPGCAYLLGILLSETDRAAEAEKLVRPFIEHALGKERATALIIAGKAALARGDAPAALVEFRAALAAEPSARVARLWEAYAYVYVGRHEEALALLDGELASMTSGEVQLFRARAYAARGNKDAAQKAFKGAYDDLVVRVAESPEVSGQHLFLAAAAEQIGKKAVAKVHRHVARQLLTTHEIYQRP
jgi:tetratricopeptide (TPR) repeat protein